MRQDGSHTTSGLEHILWQHVCKVLSFKQAETMIAWIMSLSHQNKDFEQMGAVIMFILDDL